MTTTTHIPVPAYPLGWFTVHIGLPKWIAQEHCAELIRHHPDLFEMPFIEGDSCELWGEGYEVKFENWPPFVHVQFVTPYLAVAVKMRRVIESTEWLARDLWRLHEEGAYGDGTRHIAISGSEDWATSDAVDEMLRAGDWVVREK